MDKILKMLKQSMTNKNVEKLVNEFSNFARMPRPILKKLDVIQLINKSLDFIKLTSKLQSI